MFEFYFEFLLRRNKVMQITHKDNKDSMAIPLTTITTIVAGDFQLKYIMLV